MTGLAVCSALLLVSYLVNSCLVVAIDNPIEAFPPGIDEGDLGLEIIDSGDQDDDLILPSANPMSKPFVYANHKIRVLSKYHIGYDLSVIATTGGEGGVDNRVMHGRVMGGAIQSTNDGMLVNNSWGITTGLPDAGSSNWRGFNDNPVQVLLKNRGEISQSNVPDVSETDVYYGVKVGYSTPADTYSTAVKYTLSQQIPDTPAVIKLDRSEYAIGDDDANNRLIHLTGVRFDMVTGVGVDFNGDGEINDGEGCTDWSRENGNSTNDATCNLPVFDFQLVNSANAPGADEFGGVFNLLLQDNTDRVVPSGHQITYHYQPRIDSVAVLNSDSSNALTIKDSVGIVDMASTDSASMMLTDDGGVYLWGNTPIYDGSQKVFDKTMAPMMVKLPSLTKTDYLIDIDAYGNTYYAVSLLGRLYAWGDNESCRLPLDASNNWIVTPSESKYFGTNKDNRQALMVAVGDEFGITVDKARVDDDKNMSSWGANNHGQLGRDSINDGTWMVNTVAEGSYSLIDGEKFVQADASRANVIAVTNAGRVFTWGQYGTDTRLGFNTSEDAKRPHDITYDDGGHNGNNYLRVAYHDEGKRFTKVAMGDNFAIVQAQDRKDATKTYVYTLGADNVGQNGDGESGEWGPWAHNITGQFGGKAVAGFSAGGQSAAAWTTDGQLYVWGDNSGGKLGAVGDALYAPVAVLGDYSIDKVVLGGINYARTTNGRLLAWGGENNDGSFINQYGVADITNKLAHPSYHIKVMGQNLDKSDVWLDFNRNEIMDENEKPLAKNCISTNTCYLQVSTDNAAVGEGYQIVATTPHGGRYLSGNSGVAMDVEYSTARRHEERPNDEPLLDVNGDEFVKNKSLASMQNKPSNAMATDKDSGEDDSSVLEGKDDNVDVTNNDISADPGDSSNNATGEVDSESTKDGDDLGSGQEANDNVSDDKVDSGECVCVTSGDASTDSDTGFDYNGETIDCECDDKLSGDSSKCGGMITDADCGDDMCDSLDKTNLCRCTNNSALDKLEANVDDNNLSVNISSGAQIQLIDGRRKGCVDGVGSINVDD